MDGGRCHVWAVPASRGPRNGGATGWNSRGAPSMPHRPIGLRASGAAASLTLSLFSQSHLGIYLSLKPNASSRFCENPKPALVTADNCKPARNFSEIHKPNQQVITQPCRPF